MEVSRIGSRFYENAGQSGKKVKGKQQDGFAYELQKSYDEKYRSEDTDETGMTAADGAQASGIAEFGSMGGLRAKEVVAEGVLSKAVSACEVKNLTAEDADYVEKHLAEGYVLKAKQSDDGKTVYVEQKFDDGTVKAYSVDLDKIDEETGNLIEQAAKACVQKNGKEQQTDKEWHEALEEFAAYVKNRIKNGPPKFATGATQMSVEEWDKLVKNLDDTIDDVKKVVQELSTNGYVTGRPSLGVNLVDITNEQTAMMYRVNQLGVYVLKSTNEANNLQAGDCIVSVNGTAVSSADEVKSIIQDHKVGDTLSIVIIREGKTMTVEAALQENKPDTSANDENTAGGNNGQGSSGQDSQQTPEDSQGGSLRDWLNQFGF